MGVLRYEFYSKLLGKQIRLCMVLPEQAHAGKLPDATLYLLHGGGGNAEDWLRYTSVERYADERQMAVIMPEVDGTCFLCGYEIWVSIFYIFDKRDTGSGGSAVSGE